MQGDQKPLAHFIGIPSDGTLGQHYGRDEMANLATQQAARFLILPLLLMVLAPSAHAEQDRTVYTGLSCQPHYPQNAQDHAFEYYGSEIINMAEHIDFVEDLGMNCTINRSLFGRGSRLQSVEVLLTDNSSDPDPYFHSHCHTHVEYDTGGTINVIYGPDVYPPTQETSAYIKLLHCHRRYPHRQTTHRITFIAISMATTRCSIATRS